MLTTKKMAILKKEENGDCQKGRKWRFSKRRQRDDCTLSMGLAAPNQWRKWSDPNGGFLPSTASTSLPPVCPRPPPPPGSPPPPPPPSPPPCLQFVPVLHISPQHLCLKCDNTSQKLVLKKFQLKSKTSDAALVNELVWIIRILGAFKKDNQGSSEIFGILWGFYSLGFLKILIRKDLSDEDFWNCCCLTIVGWFLIGVCWVGWMWIGWDRTSNNGNVSTPWLSSEPTKWALSSPPTLIQGGNISSIKTKLKWKNEPHNLVLGFCEGNSAKGTHVRYYSGSPTHLLLEVTFMAVGEPD